MRHKINRLSEISTVQDVIMLMPLFLTPPIGPLARFAEPDVQ